MVLIVYTTKESVKIDTAVHRDIRELDSICYMLKIEFQVLVFTCSLPSLMVRGLVGFGPPQYFSGDGFQLSCKLYLYDQTRPFIPSHCQHPYFRESVCGDVCPILVSFIS